MDLNSEPPEDPAEIAIHKIVDDTAGADEAATSAVVADVSATSYATAASETPVAAATAVDGAGPLPSSAGVAAHATDLGAPQVLGAAELPAGVSGGGDTAAAAGPDTRRAHGATDPRSNTTAALAPLGALGPLGRLQPGGGKKAPAHLVELAGFVGTTSLGAWVARYLSTEVYGLKSPHTLDAKVRDLNGFMAWFTRENGHGDIREWLPRDTSAYLSHLGSRNLAPTTINRVFATLRRFAKWAHEEPGNIFALGGLPTRGVKGVVVDEADCKKLERRDISRLLRAADVLVHLGQDSDATGQKARANARPRRNRAMLGMLYYTGLRVSEMVRLTRAQLGGSHLTNVARKGAARSRRIFLPAECRRLLDDYLGTERLQDDPGGTAEPLFVSTAGEGRNPSRYLQRQLVNRVLKRIAAQAQAMRPDLGAVAVHPHRLRHSFAAEHREKFGRDGETAAALGHTSLQYVARYTRKSDAERDAMIEEMFESHPRG